MLDKKQIRTIFEFAFKMGSEAAETTRNINNASGPGTANECTVQWWIKKCCNGDESLEDGQPLEVDNDQLRAIIEANPLTTTREVAKFGIWGKLERWKSLISGCLMSWPQIKNIFLRRCLLLFCTTTNHFSIEFWHATKSRFYTTTGNNQLSGWTQKKLQKPLPKAKRALKKRSWSLVVCCHSDTLQLSESQPITSKKYTQQINEIHWKLQCPQPTLVNRKGPILLHDNAWPHTARPVLQKLHKSGYKVLPHLPHSPDLSPTYYDFFEHLDNFLQGKHFHDQQEAGNAFPEFVEFRSMDFMLRE